MENRIKAVAWPCIYVASRASIPARSQMWRDFRASGHRISAVILYAETGDFPLKGALIECGIALGTN